MTLKEMENKVIKFIDLFAGIGGFKYGLEKASKDFICVWSNEYDKYARAIYEKHWGKGSCDPRDIRTVDPADIPDFDLLCAGFPCQSFSIAGKRGGFSDTRGTLFFDICRILQAKRPGYCLLENVKGLLSHDNGKTFQIILESLADLGYDCQWQVLNSKYFGVPQNRERVFIIGHLREKPRPKVFPITETGSIYFKSVVSTAIDSNYHKGWLDHGQRQMIQEGFINSDSQGQRVYNPEGVSAQINSQGGGWGAKTGLYLTPYQGDKITPENEIMPTLPSQGENNLKGLGILQKDMRIRRLTPLECERLQGFPDGWTEGVSDTQRYKCLGNAVTTNVITFLGERLRQEILLQPPQTTMTKHSKSRHPKPKVIGTIEFIAGIDQFNNEPPTYFWFPQVRKDILDSIIGWMNRNYSKPTTAGETKKLKITVEETNPKGKR